MFVPPLFRFPAKLDPVFLLLNPEQRRQTSRMPVNSVILALSGAESRDDDVVTETDLF